MKTISFPFRIDGFGNVATTTDPSRIWADRVRAVVSTYVGERIMRPDFGSNVARASFDVLSGLPDLLNSDMSVAFSRWLPGITFGGVTLTSDQEGTTHLAVNYSIPTLEKNSDTNYTITI